MGVNYNPKTITDQLIISLDSANSKSYPGSGTTWYDLSKNSLSGSLFNGVSYDAGNSGSLFFDGVNQYFDMNDAAPSVAGLTEYSASIWINIDSSATGINARFFWHGNYGVLVYKPTDDRIIFYLRTDIGTYQISYYSVVFNTWMNICATFGSESIKLFVDGLLKSSTSAYGGIINSTPTRFRLGGSSGSYFTDCKISNVSVYQKELTEQEVEQNFNAIRGRYGI